MGQQEFTPYFLQQRAVAKTVRLSFAVWAERISLYQVLSDVSCTVGFLNIEPERYFTLSSSSLSRNCPAYSQVSFEWIGAPKRSAKMTRPV